MQVGKPMKAMKAPAISLLSLTVLNSSCNFHLMQLLPGHGFEEESCGSEGHEGSALERRAMFQ